MTIMKNRKKIHVQLKMLILLLSTFTLVSMTALVTAADAPQRQVFNLTNAEGVMKTIAGTAAIIKSDEIQITAPSIAELGREVGVGVRIKGLKNVESITLLGEKNLNPMIASFKIAKGTTPFIKSRVKLSKSSRLIVLVKADGKYYRASRTVKVTRGGC